MVLLQYDHEPHIEKSKRKGGHHKEIHRRDCAPVIVQESNPVLLLPWIRCSLREITRDGCETDGEAELLEFGLDLPSTPVILG